MFVYTSYYGDELRISLIIPTLNPFQNCHATQKSCDVEEFSVIAKFDFALFGGSWTRISQFLIWFLWKKTIRYGQVL